MVLSHTGWRGRRASVKGRKKKQTARRKQGLRVKPALHRDSAKEPTRDRWWKPPTPGRKTTRRSHVGPTRAGQSQTKIPDLRPKSTQPWGQTQHSSHLKSKPRKPQAFVRLNERSKQIEVHSGVRAVSTLGSPHLSSPKLIRLYLGISGWQDLQL